MYYTPAQVEKLLTERDWMMNHPKTFLADLGHANAELLEVMLAIPHTYHQAAIAVYGDEEAA